MTAVETSGMSNRATSAGVRAQIRHSLLLWRRRLLWQRLLNTLAAIAVLALIGHLLATAPSTLLQQAAALVLLFFLQLVLGPAWRRSNPDNFVEHLNRRFPDFEESARLLLADEDGLTPLQNLQRERVLAVWQKNMSQVDRWQMPVRYRPALAVIAGCILLGLFSDQLSSLATRFLAASPVAPGDRTAAGMDTRLDVIAVRIEPPAYTGLEATTTNRLDLELPEGSRVEWILDFDKHGAEYALRLSGGEQTELQRGGDGHLHASSVINRTDLYRIVDTRAGYDESIGAVYSLTVMLDRAPDIRIVEPDVPVLEIPKAGPARFDSQALIKDDYGLQGVEILASVAKGSGEGVKFRDQALDFDRAIDTGNGQLYQRQWDLEALGMEPGDEIYFTVVATDNRFPQANTGRSDTLIVRWLEDEKPILAADGLGIDFIPEFFKSQRQIIIETEQLIEDRPQLAAQVFKDTSYGIGQAQADLKEKYGQYLGDEFGEGPGEQLDQPHTEAADSAGAHEQHENEHGATDSGSLNKNLNSTADIIRLYGHDHGDPEIGPITRRNPVALMKRAVSEMWQAERHLMQASPERALPFEYEAYKYLKLARQADRIYVKRLGFEPPPVSEDRRLSGKRDEILSYRLAAPGPGLGANETQSEQQLLKLVYHMLKEHSSDNEYSESEREILHRLGRQFTLWSQQRAAFIQHAATLEKLALGDRLQADSCDTCMAELETAIWNLIRESDGQLHHRNAAWYASDGLIDAYRQARKQNAAKDNVGDQR